MIKNIRHYVFWSCMAGASYCVPSAYAAPTAGNTVAAGNTSGTEINLSAQGEVKRANDQAVLTLQVEEQDKDKAVAASRVNAKMTQGAQIVRFEDPSAQLKTRAYYTFPVYPDEVAPGSSRTRQPTAWRVGQYLDVTTKNLPKLPKLVAATQRVLALSAVNFGLSETTLASLDEQRIKAAYTNLSQRIGFMAKAMGRSTNDFVITSINLDGIETDRAPRMVSAMSKANMVGADMQQAVAEPSFDPGETTLPMQMTARVIFK